MKTRRKRASEPRTVADWTKDVVGLIREEWPELDAISAGVITDALARDCAEAVPARLELLIDPGPSGNWRLKRDLDGGRWGLRVADYRLTHLHQPPGERELRLNAALKAVVAPGEGT